MSLRQVKRKANGGVTAREQNERKLNHSRGEKRRESVMKMVESGL